MSLPAGYYHVPSEGKKVIDRHFCADAKGGFYAGGGQNSMKPDAGVAYATKNGTKISVFIVAVGPHHDFVAWLQKKSGIKDYNKGNWYHIK